MIRAMDIIFSHATALAIIRSWRSSGEVPTCPQTHPLPSVPSLTEKVTVDALSELLAAASVRPEALIRGEHRLDVLCSREGTRPHGRYVCGHVAPHDLKGYRQLWMKGGSRMSSVGLTLSQLATSLPLCELLDVANELEGGYSRDPVRPVLGAARFDISPFISKDEVLWELFRLPRGRTTERARTAVALSCPNAWSPREGILATMLVLPCHEGGYNLGPITLNQRLTADSPAITSLRSRVPDISFHQAPIGLNYDGREHLALSLLERTAMEVGLHPGDGSAFQELRSVRGAIRRKYVDDRRRDRDLATMGLETMVVTSEDMDDIRSLDLLMLQVIARIEHHVGIHLWEQRTCIDDPRCTTRRQEVLAHLLDNHT